MQAATTAPAKAATTPAPEAINDGGKGGVLRATAYLAPFRYPFISGMPEPHATGSTYATSTAATST